MMIYSVFNWNTGRYRYYDGPGEGLGVRPQGQVLNDERGHHQMEALLPLVPHGSVPAGEGDEPRGRIATTGNEPGAASGGGSGGSLISGFGDSNPLVSAPWLTLGLWAGVMLLALKAAGWIGHEVEKRIK
jgi:hypothetical protein